MKVTKKIIKEIIEHYEDLKALYSPKEALAKVIEFWGYLLDDQ